MVFWLGILAGAILAGYAVKRGFYETWATFFNMIIAVYLAVALGPALTQLVPAAGKSTYGQMLTMLVTGLGCFALLHALVYIIALSQFRVNFPKSLEILGAGLLGFLGGILVWSFVVVLIASSPLANNKVLKGMGFGESAQSNISYLAWWVDLVDSVVAAQGPDKTEQTLKGLLDRTTVPAKRKPLKEKPTSPKPPAEVNEAIVNPLDLGPPPELESENL